METQYYTIIVSDGAIDIPADLLYRFPTIEDVIRLGKLEPGAKIEFTLIPSLEVMAWIIGFYQQFPLVVDDGARVDLLGFEGIENLEKLYQTCRVLDFLHSQPLLSICRREAIFKTALTIEGAYGRFMPCEQESLYGMPLRIDPRYKFLREISASMADYLPPITTTKYLSPLAYSNDNKVLWIDGNGQVWRAEDDEAKSFSGSSMERVISIVMSEDVEMYLTEEGDLWGISPSDFYSSLGMEDEVKEVATNVCSVSCCTTHVLYISKSMNLFGLGGANMDMARGLPVINRGSEKPKASLTFVLDSFCGIGFSLAIRLDHSLWVCGTLPSMGIKTEKWLWVRNGVRSVVGTASSTLFIDERDWLWEIVAGEEPKALMPQVESVAIDDSSLTVIDKGGGLWVRDGERGELNCIAIGVVFAIKGAKEYYLVSKEGNLVIYSAREIIQRKLEEIIQYCCRACGKPTASMEHLLNNDLKFCNLECAQSFFRVIK